MAQERHHLELSLGFWIILIYFLHAHIWREFLHIWRRVCLLYCPMYIIYYCSTLLWWSVGLVWRCWHGRLRTLLVRTSYQHHIESTTHWRYRDSNVSDLWWLCNNLMTLLAVLDAFFAFFFAVWSNSRPRVSAVKDWHLAAITRHPHDRWVPRTLKSITNYLFYSYTHSDMHAPTARRLTATKQQQRQWSDDEQANTYTNANELNNEHATSAPAQRQQIQRTH